MSKLPHNSIKKPKAILHMDGDAFFVGVEVAKNPKLRGLPVVTGEERGIVSALSYEAKALGITRGMPIFQIKRNFSNVIILPGDYKSYIRYSTKMFDIVRRYADDVEEYSIDECFADLTGVTLHLKMTAFQIAKRIKEEVSKELDLSVSIGVAPTKVLAKVASKWQKPNGLTLIKKDDIGIFLKETAIGKIWGIGPKISAFLHTKCVETAYDFANKDREWVRENLSRPYEIIFEELNGVYTIPIDPKPKTSYSSIQKTRSFSPATNNKAFLLSEISKHIEEACFKARYFNLTAKKITFFIKTKNFRYKTLSLDLLHSTNTPEALQSLLEERFYEIYEKKELYRTTGVVLRDLRSNGFAQGNLFGVTKADRFEAVHKKIDALEEKLGKRVVHLASTHESLTREKIGSDAEEIDRHLLFL
jgi:nucleotidyltransferase/DNA polymerase involved in DNA repair